MSRDRFADRFDGLTQWEMDLELAGQDLEATAHAEAEQEATQDTRYQRAVPEAFYGSAEWYTALARGEVAIEDGVAVWVAR